LHCGRKDGVNEGPLKQCRYEENEGKAVKIKREKKRIHCDAGGELNGLKVKHRSPNWGGKKKTQLRKKKTRVTQLKRTAAPAKEGIKNLGRKKRA